MGPSVIDIAVQTLRIEADALHDLADSLDDTSDFTEVIESIAVGAGRVVVTGIGKSAIVAQKITATFNSTGTPSLFLHAAEAIHGDLGMVRPEDFVLCLSKSGESPEIKVLASLVKSFGNPLIAMTAVKDSTLAKQSDYLLWTPVKKEADPNNLAPTASTTVQMALGDAMAVALLLKKGFSPEDFAKFHPGGALGKQLYLRVADLYPLHEKPAVRENADLRTLILEISSKRLGAAAVIDPDERPLGIVTDGDLRRLMQSGQADIFQKKAAEVMNPSPKTVSPEALAVEALSLMRRHSITQLMVVSGNRYLGMVHLHDLLKEGIV